MEYKILSATTLEELESDVNDLLGVGWCLYGDLKVHLRIVDVEHGVFIFRSGGHLYIQAMTKGGYDD